MSKWPEFKIDELKASSKNAIAMGPFGSRIKAENFVEAGVPIIKGGNLHGDFLREDKYSYLTDEKATELKTSNAFRRDIVITHRGTIGQVGIIPDDSKFERYVVSQSQLKVTLDQEKVNPYFVYYFLRSPLGQHRLLLNSSQVGVPAIAQASTSVKGIMVPCPDKDIQDRIVEMLLNLDHKIELNRQTNQTLEHMAQAIFKSWFVDFEPTRAKIAAKEEWAKRSMTAKAGGSDNNIKESQAEATFVERAAMAAISGRAIDSTNDSATGALAGLDQLNPEQIEQLKTTAALFPDALVDSEIGEIPEGWEVGVVGDLFELHRGFDLPKKDRKDGAYPVFAAGGYHGQHAEFKMEPPGIITGRSGVIGNVYLSLEKYWPLNTTLYVREFKKCGPYYAYFYLLGCDLKAINSGSAVPSLNRNFVHSLTCYIPGSDLLDEFEQVLTASFKKIKLNEDESEKLSVIRDALLPKLLSGDLEISEAG
jgi:type I restriction enzyme S subunit